MALIDKETICAEIERRYAEYRAKMKTDDFTYYEGMADALDLFEQFIDSLSEQPKLKPMNIPSAGGGNEHNPSKFQTGCQAGATGR